MALGILILAVIVILLTRRIFSNKKSGYDKIKSRFSPMDIYKQLSPENKGAFWSVTVSAVFGIFTCWLGFSVQYLINDSMQTESEKVAHHQIVDRFMPLYEELSDSCSNVVFKTLYKSLAYSETPNGKERSNNMLYIFFLDNNNWDNIIHTTKKTIEISSRLAPYVDEDVRNSLIENNTLMFIGCQLIGELKNADILDEFSFVDKLSEEYLNEVPRNTINPNTSGLMYIYKECYPEYLDIKKNDNREKALKVIVDFLTSPMIINTDFLRKEIWQSKEINNNKPQPYKWEKLQWKNLTDLQWWKKNMKDISMWWKEEMKDISKWWKRSQPIVNYLLIALLFIFIVIWFVLHKVFDRNSMKSTPTNLDKLKKERDSHEKDKLIFERSYHDKEQEVKELQSELSKEKAKTEAQMKINKELTATVDSSKKMIEYQKSTIHELETTIKILSEEIQRLEENKE